MKEFRILLSVVASCPLVLSSTENSGAHQWAPVVQSNLHFHSIYDPNTRRIAVGENRKDLEFENTFVSTPRLIGNYIYIYAVLRHPDDKPLKLYDLAKGEKFSGDFPEDVRDYLAHEPQALRKFDEDWMVQVFSRFDQATQSWTRKHYLIRPINGKLHFAFLLESERLGFWADLAEGRLAFRSVNSDEVEVIMVPPDESFERMDIPKGDW